MAQVFFVLGLLLLPARHGLGQLIHARFKLAIEINQQSRRSQPTAQQQRYHADKDHADRTPGRCRRFVTQKDYLRRSATACFNRHGMGHAADLHNGLRQMEDGTTRRTTSPFAASYHRETLGHLTIRTNILEKLRLAHGSIPASNPPSRRSVRPGHCVHGVVCRVLTRAVIVPSDRSDPHTASAASAMDASPAFVVPTGSSRRGRCVYHRAWRCDLSYKPLFPCPPGSRRNQIQSQTFASPNEPGRASVGVRWACGSLLLLADASFDVQRATLLGNKPRWAIKFVGLLQSR
jgi:hypothetical protein